jgi:predicted nuclease with TOPRIM domain
VSQALGYDRAMARTRSTTKQNDILSRFTELGHEALNKLSDVPGGSRVVDMMNESKARLDEMQKKLRGLDELEKRVAKLEKQVAATAKPAPKRKPAARKPTTSKSPPAA